MQNSVDWPPALAVTSVPFGVTYEKIGTIQRRLAWPLHKDDTLSRSGRPTGLNIYFLCTIDIYFSMASARHDGAFATSMATLTVTPTTTPHHQLFTSRFAGDFSFSFEASPLNHFEINDHTGVRRGICSDSTWGIGRFVRAVLGHVTQKRYTDHYILFRI